jgi:anti-sigma B factor antagonist
MEITSSTDGDLVQFHLAGKFDATTSRDVGHAVSDAISRGCRRLIFDMRDVNYISSAGLRAILIAARQANAAGGGVAVFGLQGNVEQVFAVSGFDTIVALATGEAAARAAITARQD